MADTNKHGIAEGPDYTPGIIAPPAPDTMKIASDDTESGFIIINTADFDKATMKKYVEAKAKVEPPAT